MGWRCRGRRQALEGPQGPRTTRPEPRGSDAAGGALLAAAWMAASLVIGAAHPHLFFEAGDVAALRTAAAGTHKEIASHLTSILSQHLGDPAPRSEEHTSELQSHVNLVCRLLLE